MVTNLPANAGDMDSIPGSGRLSRGGNGNPLQYSCLRNPKDRGAWFLGLHEHNRASNTRLPEGKRLGEGEDKIGKEDRLCGDRWK